MTCRFGFLGEIVLYGVFPLGLSLEKVNVYLRH